MAYVKTVFSTGDTITATLANHWETQFDEVKVEVEKIDGTSAIKPDWSNVKNKAHASSHASAGSDPITPANIGAETPAGAQSKADTAETNATNFAKSYGLGSTAYSWSNKDLNTALAGGWYRGSGMTNAPSTDWYYVEVIQHASTWVVQIATRLHADIMWMRRLYNGTWQPWVKIYNSGTDGAGSGLDADLLDGKHASEFALASEAGKVAAGSYTGDGVANRSINVGFTPKFVFVHSISGMVSSVFAYGAIGHISNGTANGYMLKEGGYMVSLRDAFFQGIVTDGFQTGDGSSTNGTNNSGWTYKWTAIG